MQTPEFKVSLIGPSGSGKSSFAKRLLYGYNHISVCQQKRWENVCRASEAKKNI